MPCCMHALPIARSKRKRLKRLISFLPTYATTIALNIHSAVVCHASLQSPSSPAHLSYLPHPHSPNCPRKRVRHLTSRQ
ncbi:hypothetical protein HDK90DRAFT_473013 [Phyllosticta capitalensis]|uniref:Uncharacterized protein n=1 Tax=Phyllosticta capitalensis TaxID=121624 RepID=A0ABR1Z4C2_9PEZI